MTCPDANTLAELADGALDDAARATLERHLDDCGACSELVAELAWIVAPPPPAPPGYELGAPLGDRTWQVRAATHTAAVTYGATCDPRWCEVRHPHVATVFDIGERDGEPYIVHELVTTTERAWRDAAPRSPDAIVVTWRAALDGLAALHAAGLAHGQVSPDHVFVEAGGRVVVGPPLVPLAPTSGYLAPERLNGAPPSPASDQFSACVAIWEALANQPPFSGATVGALLVSTSIALEPPDPDRRFATLARGLSAAPAARFASIAELSAALDHPGRRTPLAIAIAVVVVVIAIIVVALAA